MWTAQKAVNLIIYSEKKWFFVCLKQLPMRDALRWVIQIKFCVYKNKNKTEKPNNVWNNEQSFYNHKVLHKLA